MAHAQESHEQLQVTHSEKPGWEEGKGLANSEDYLYHWGPQGSI